MRCRIAPAGGLLETRVLKGKPVAALIREEVSTASAALRDRGVVPTLAIMQVGDDPSSKIYCSSIQKAGGKLGVDVVLSTLPASSSVQDVTERIAALGTDPSIHGIIVLEPLPHGIPSQVLEEIPPAKDVDGATALSLGLIVAGRPAYAPCTAQAVVEMLVRSGIEISGRHVVIVGRSPVVGRPLANMLLRKADNANATVTVCHTRTRDLSAHTMTADILVAAMGVPEAIRGEMLAEGVVIIDVGVNRIDDPSSERGHRVVGDVAYDEALGIAAAITPVPGGVGTLTTSLLLLNTIDAATKAGVRAP